MQSFLKSGKLGAQGKSSNGAPSDKKQITPWVEK